MKDIKEGKSNKEYPYPSEVIKDRIIMGEGTSLNEMIIDEIDDLHDRIKKLETVDALLEEINQIVFWECDLETDTARNVMDKIRKVFNKK